METIYKLKPYELNEDVLQMLKGCYNKAITITIKESQDETAYLLSNEVNRKILLERIEAVKRGKVAHTLSLEEVEAMAK